MNGYHHPFANRKKVLIPDLELLSWNCPLGTILSLCTTDISFSLSFFPCFEPLDFESNSLNIRTSSASRFWGIAGHPLEMERFLFFQDVRFWWKSTMGLKWTPSLFMALHLFGGLAHLSGILPHLRRCIVCIIRIVKSSYQIVEVSRQVGALVFNNLTTIPNSEFNITILISNYDKFIFSLWTIRAHIWSPFASMVLFIKCILGCHLCFPLLARDSSYIFFCFVFDYGESSYLIRRLFIWAHTSK